jgi:hypothetical protein
MKKKKKSPVRDEILVENGYYRECRGVPLGTQYILSCIVPNGTKMGVVAYYFYQYTVPNGTFSHFRHFIPNLTIANNHTIAQYL